MLTILEAINLSANYLQQKGIDSPRTNAELLLSSILKCKRLELYLSFDKPISDEEKALYREYIRRRGNYEPLQYITGEVEFYGINLKINPSVLIPRPETEILVESIINNYKKDDELTILDIGCGSGCIGIALAVNLPNARIICTDMNEDVLSIAKFNSEKNQCTDRIEFKKHDVLKEDLNIISKTNVVVSNPPYVSVNAYPTLQKEIKNYEPRFAVTDDADGLTFYRAISSKAKNAMKEKGKIFFELSDGQSGEVLEILKENGFKEIKIIKDYQQIDRIIYGVKE
jgi:release factor glutamine methyltransferase